VSLVLDMILVEGVWMWDVEALGIPFDRDAAEAAAEPKAETPVKDAPKHVNCKSKVGWV